MAYNWRKFDMKKILFSTLLLLAMAIGATAQTETLTVNDGDATSSYVPVYGFYADAYLKCEYVIPSTQIEDMANGTISAMKFYLSTPATDSWGDANFQIFMNEVSETTIDAYYGQEGATLVYEGALDGTQSEMEITFTNDYVYNGGNLLIGVYNTVTGSYKSATFSGASATGAGASGAGAASGAVTTNQRNFLPKNTFTYTPGVLPTCYRPTSLAVSDVDLTSATLSWNAQGSETAWQICINGDEDNLVNVTTNPYTLENLTAATVYSVKVRANCGETDGVSTWSNIVNFTTPYCAVADMCEISYTLTDSYGDGWNGSSAINVVDVATSEVIATLKLSTGSSLDGTLSVCNGRNLSFVWVTGSYDNECSYVVYDVNDDEIFSGSGAMSEAVNYTVNCSSCKKPANLQTSTLGPRFATLTWTAGADETAWQVCINNDEENLINVTAATYEMTGLTPETDYSVKVRSVCSAELQSNWAILDFTTTELCPAPSNITVSNITTTTADVAWEGIAEGYNLRYRPSSTPMATVKLTVGDVWGDGSGYQMLLDADATAYGTIIPTSGALTSGGDVDASIYDEFEYKIPEEADGALSTTNIVINNTIEIAIPAGIYDWCITNPTPGDRMWIAASNGNVGGRQDDYEFVAGATYEFTVAIDPNGSGNDAVEVVITGASKARKATRDEEWIVVNDVTSPHALTGLTPGQCYEVQVMSTCGADGESAWTSSKYFTTISSCPNITNLVVTDTTENSATLAWTGYQENYNVRYREAATSPIIYFTDFEEGIPEGWTIVDSDGDGFNWESHINTGTGNHSTHSGDGVVCSASYDNNGTGALYPDNWLISPQVTLGGHVSFYANGQDGSYSAEHFAIYVSTTDTDPASFTQVSEEFIATSSYLEYTADLSSYSGQGYVAIRHFNISDMFILNVDDFGIYDADIPAGDWINLTATDATITLNNLNPNTTYEWQVQGVCENDVLTDWSAINVFTTPLPTSATIEEATLAIYPNPNNGMFNIEFGGIEGEATYQLIDARGSIVATNNINVANGETMSFSHNLKAGAYFVRIITTDKVYVEQIVVE